MFSLKHFYYCWLCQFILARVKKAGTKKQKYEKISEKKMSTPIEALKWLDICQFYRDLRPAEKGGKKKKKKTLVLTLGSLPDLDFKTWTSRPRFQDLGLRTWVSRLRQTHATHPAVVSSFSRHFSLRPPSLFFFPSRSLCIQWSQTNCVQWS
jgi:hypothetical protein